MKKIAIIAVLAALGVGSAFAASSTNTFKSTAVINSSCVMSTTNVNMGDITNSGTNGISASGNITVLCNRLTPYRIFQGFGVNGGINGRLLKHTTAASTVPYLICTQPGVNNGNCLNNSRWYPPEYFGTNSYHVAGSGTGISQQIPVYLTVYAGYVTPGTYTDSVVTTLSF